MSWPINATLYVEVFTPTGNQGEYAFTNAVFNNQADGTGNGAFDAAVGANIYVQATSLNSGAPVPGVMHRYKLTVCTPVDTNTLSGVITWSEPGIEEDTPTSGSFCLYAQATTGHGFGLVPSEQTYTDLPSGSSVQSLVLDVRDITDTLGSGGGTAPITLSVSGITVDDTPNDISHSLLTHVPVDGESVFRTTVFGHDPAQVSERCAFIIEGMLFIDPENGLSILGGTITTVLARTTSSWDAQVSANPGTGALDITVTGSIGTSVHWSATTVLTNSRPALF